MEKVLEKKEVTKKVDPNLVAIEKLIVLNRTLAGQVQVLFSDLDDLKSKVAQVASRLGL